MSTFRALLVEKQDDGSFTRGVVERSVDDLPKGELLVEVAYSSLNYKDGLSASGNPGVSRNFPHTPGIDVAGVVLESSVDAFTAVARLGHYLTDQIHAIAFGEKGHEEKGRPVVVAEVFPCAKPHSGAPWLFQEPRYGRRIGLGKAHQLLRVPGQPLVQPKGLVLVVPPVNEVLKLVSEGAPGQMG